MNEKGCSESKSKSCWQEISDLESKKQLNTREFQNIVGGIAGAKKDSIALQSEAKKAHKKHKKDKMGSYSEHK